MTGLRRLLLAWFAENRRPLPWRENYAPYQVWIAEMMGQQTQLSRVAEYFGRWIREFPDVETLAAAPEQAVLKAWEGLGYYSRAHNIRKAARIIVEEYGGKVPDEETALVALPGIGPYTAAAILSIGYNRPVALVDTNVARIFARLFNFAEPIKTGDGKKAVADWAHRFLDPKDARTCNEALMEFGELICTPKRPSCTKCPLLPHCLAKKRETVSQRPAMIKKPERIDIYMSCGIIRDKGKFFIQQRLQDDVWGGLWEFPGGQMEPGEHPENTVKREILEETGWCVQLGTPFRTVVHHYTRYQVTLHSFFCSLESGQTAKPRLTAASQYAWVDLKQLGTYPFPAGHRQIVAALTENLSLFSQ